jgi:AcrR family transcriptional regulator
MNKKANIPTGSAAERIMTVASELFYRQGYRATGINEVIQQSGVAKATFYSNFRTKDDLALAYLKKLRKDEEAYVSQAIQSVHGPRERFLEVIRCHGPWLETTNFRGCGFINMASEIPGPDSPLRKEGQKIYDSARALISSLSKALIASDKQKYGHLDPEQLTNDYMLILAGTFAQAEIYHSMRPQEQAEQAVLRLIGE